MSVQLRLLSGMFAAVLAVVCARPAAAQDKPSLEVVFGYKPSQKDVEVQTPTAEELPKCKVEVERSGTTSGWAVFGPQGEILRRFVDTDDADDVVDQWRYYKNGLEVYRDIDSDGNADKSSKPDQCRWLTTAGTRWGIDADHNGKIEEWKMISAEEASREAIKAIAAGDIAAFSAVVISAADIKELGLSPEIAQKLQPLIQDPAGQLTAALKGSTLIKRDTKWIRFDSSMLMPNIVPAESGVAGRDLHVYENVMAIVETGTGGKPGFVAIAEMVRVGDVWKLTDVPRPVNTDDGAPIQITNGGLLIQPQLAGLNSAVGAEPTPEMKQLIEQLQKIDQAAQAKPDASRQDVAAYNAQRAQLLGRLSDVAPTADERETWRRQQIDQIAAAVQLDAFANGVEALTAIEADIRKRPDGAPLVPYVVYRRMTAEYNTQMKLADASQQMEVQANWLTLLEKYVADFPQSIDAADAMLQIAMAQEFMGKVTDAKTWYTRIAEGHAQSQAGAVATGALRRLNLKGQPLVLSGPVLGAPGVIDIAKLRGKVVIVLFWATWCRPCIEELPQLQELYKLHKAAGLEVIGVNVDSEGAPIQEHITQYKIAWPSIHEAGGLQSSVAQQYGVITLPTTFLVDKSGKVISAAANVDDLKKQVPELLKE